MSIPSQHLDAGMTRTLRLLGLTLVLLALARGLYAEGWDDRITDARARADGIETWAAGYGWDYNAIGRIARFVDVAAIRCEILAEMIGIGDIASYLEYVGPRPDEFHAPPTGPIDPDTYDFYQILGYSMNLGHWARAAEEFLTQSDDQRAEAWELTCNGQNRIPDGLLGPDWNTSASFRVDDGILYVLGDIVPGFFEEFEAALSQNEIRAVSLGSRGGSVLDAMQAGGLIRARGLQTDLYGDCESACPLIFIGGRPPRDFVAPANIHRLGFHQLSSNGVALPLDSDIYETIGAYVKAMGVDDDFVLAAMRSAPPDDMSFPDLGALCAADVIGWVTYQVTYDCPRPD